MKSCPDGYPSCRKAESEGVWCRGACEALKPAQIVRTRISGKRVVHYLASGAVNIIHVGKPLKARIVYAAELRPRKSTC